MREAYGDLWTLFSDSYATLVVTTNGTVKKNGHGVMGRGIALEAKKRWPDMERRLGAQLTVTGNHVEELAYVHVRAIDSMHRPIVRFPVKHNWWERADMDLIVRSAHELVALTDERGWSGVLLPRPGCGNGGLRWDDVKSRIEDVLDDRFVAVTK